MMYSGAAIPQIVAIRCCTHKKNVPHFRYLGCVLQYAVIPNTPVHTLRSPLLFSHFPQSTTKLPLIHGPKATYFSNCSETKSRKNGPPAGRLQRAPHQPGGGGVAAKPRPVSASPKRRVHWSGPVYWHMTQPVHTVLVRATPGPRPR